MLVFTSAFATPAQPQPPRVATSADGTRIAYDVSGRGPVVMLLHGGGQTRRAWHSAGYVAQLQNEFTTIAVDMRGNGDSDKPTTPAAYHIDRLVEDVIAVADAVNANRFGLWGFSYGATIAVTLLHAANESSRWYISASLSDPPPTRPP